MDQAAELCESLTIRWVKAHRGHKGNVMADDAAVAGRDSSAAPVWDSPLLAKAVMHSEIDALTLRLWESTWEEVIGCRQTRHFYPTGPRKNFFKSMIHLPRIIVGQLIQILTGHTFLKRHQAIIDESDRQRTLEALKINDDTEYPNADNDGNAIIDEPDPTCSRCHNGNESPEHLLAECDALGGLRLSIFGKEKLVEPGEFPDFSNLKPYQLVAFFREAKFDTLTMHPFLAQYLPTEKLRNADDQGMKDAKAQGFKRGNEWTSKYLFHIPLVQGFRRKKKKKEGEEDGEELNISERINREERAEADNTLEYNNVN